MVALLGDKTKVIEDESEFENEFQIDEDTKVIKSNDETHVFVYECVSK